MFMYIIIVKGILKVNEMFCKSCGNEITTNDILIKKEILQELQSY